MKRESMSIPVRPDVKLLLDGEPFPRPVNRLEIDTNIEEVGDPDLEPIIQEVRSRTLRLYDGERLLATTGSFDINPTTRTISMLRRKTTFA